MIFFHDEPIRQIDVSLDSVGRLNDRKPKTLITLFKS